MYELTDTKPLPSAGSTPARRRYPFRSMAVGQSFDFPSSEYRKTYSAATMYAKRNGVAFTIKSNRDGTCTCWRAS